MREVRYASHPCLWVDSGSDPGRGPFFDFFLLFFFSFLLFLSLHLTASRDSVNPVSLVPHLEHLQTLFLADTPVLALTATRRLRVPEGRQAVEIAIDFLRSKSPESELTYSFGMSEAARAKFK